MSPLDLPEKWRGIYRERVKSIVDAFHREVKSIVDAEADDFMERITAARKRSVDEAKPIFDAVVKEMETC